MLRYSVLLLFLALSGPVFAETVHGLALYDQPKYPAGFQHFDYVNPEAPKGGQIRLGVIGSYDSLNPFILRGQPAAGSGLVFETLTEPSLDEAFSQYGRLAETIEVGPDRQWVAFTLRAQARFSDGTPVTAEDVLWSFEILRTQGHPHYRSYYLNVAKAEQTGPRTVRFTFNSLNNRELPLIMGELPVLPKHVFTEKRPFNQTWLEPVPGSGPYKIAEVQAGRTLVLARNQDWWGRDLPINRGRYNFDTLRFEYYRDADIAFEAFKAGQLDLRLENSSKNWATGYDIPAIKEGRIVREEIRHQDPQGMQGYIFNTRRELFSDRKVRMALAYLFDFEWAQANLMYGQYKRTASFFSNSELAAEGLPSAAELQLLAPYRGKEPDEVFTSAFQPPKTDGSGTIRPNQRVALDLFRQAGWELHEGHLVKTGTNQPFSFEILLDNPQFERITQPYLRNLERVGIAASIRMVDSAQYQNRLDKFDFDMVIERLGQSLSPGNEQRDYWTSAQAALDGSKNLAGVRDPVVDDLVNKLIAASTRSELINTTRALDRVLLWNWYVIPQWHSDSYRVAYWNRFGHPAQPARYGFPYESTWWVAPEKTENTKP